MLALVTFVGHLLGRRASSAQTFFTSEGGLPWWAVSASLYATVLSAVSFISVPTSVFRDGGNLTFLQIVFGLALGKVVTAAVFVRPYYESRSVETVFDYLSARIGAAVSRGVMGLQIISLLALNSIVVVSAALVLDTLTGFSLPVSCLIIVGFAALWSWMGGLSTVVWTDVMLFGVFIAGAAFSVALTFVASNVSPGEAISLLDDRAKLTLIDLSTDPTKAYTLWTGVLTGTLLGLIPVTSQSGMQRIRACRSLRDARLAFVFSVVLYVTPVLLLAVGLGLSLYYGVNGVPPELAQRLLGHPDQAFPYFIVNEIPVGVSGVLIAAVFAAAISTLDSRLTELADITIRNVYRPYLRPGASDAHYLRGARLCIVLWAGVFSFTSVGMTQIDGQSLIDLTLMVSNTLGGPILGTFLLARYGIGSTLSVVVGAAISIGVTAYLYSIGVTHYWWFPVAVLVMLSVGRIANPGPLDRDGTVDDAHPADGAAIPAAGDAR